MHDGRTVSGTWVCISDDQQGVSRGDMARSIRVRRILRGRGPLGLRAV